MKQTGIYTSNDTIENLCLKLTFLKLNSLLEVHTYKNVSKTTNVETPECVADTFTFKWQEKRLGRHEFRKYSDNENCQTDLQKKYHLLAIERSPSDPPVIFTYIDEDNHESSAEFSHQSRDNWIALDAVKKSISGHSTFTRMQVMAHLEVDSNAETELFALSWCSMSRKLFVYPDFNDIIATPYLQEVNTISRHWYQFALENVSAVRGTLSLEPVIDLNNSPKTNLLAYPNVADCFINPSTSTIGSDNLQFVSVLHELTFASQFDCNELHVVFRFQLPKNCTQIYTDCTSDASNHLMVTTQTMRRTHNTEYWWFGCTSELNFVISNASTEPIQISYEVLSPNRWSHEDVKGWAAHSLPLKPGTRDDRLQCVQDLCDVQRIDWWWWPFRTRSSNDSHHRKTLEADYLAAATSAASRCGLRTRTAGQLCTRTHIIIQKPALDYVSEMNEVLLGSTQSSSTGSKRVSSRSIDEVVAAYELAKLRLFAVSEERV